MMTKRASSEKLVQMIFYGNPDIYPPIINGMRLLAKAGYPANILCRQDDKEWGIEYPSGSKIQRIAFESNNSWKEYLSFVIKVLRQSGDRPAIFIAHDMHGLLPARLLATRFRLPLVYHCHDFAENARAVPLGVRIVRAFERRFARTADIVIVPDAERAKVVARELKLKRRPLIVANAPLRSITTTGERLRETLDLQGKQFSRILFRQGRIGVGHAIEATIRSLPFWANRDWGFVVMGLQDTSFVEKMQGIASELGVARQFVALPPVGYDNVAQFTRGADVGHALYEPIHINNVHITTASNKIMEYMAAGLPMLVSDTPALRALVEKYECGLTANEKSPRSIASAINILLGDTEGVQRMGAASRQAFEDVFCYERQFASVLNAFQRLV
jgi:glycosyltransferase involved in cell wall biosynthesis